MAPRRSRYDAFPDHSLCGIDPAILDVAREAMQEAVDAGDVHSEIAEPLADSIVMALREAGHIK